MKRTGTQGVSLVELLIVIALITILSAIAYPVLGGFVENRNLRSAARDVMGDFFTFKERTLAENQQYVITFNVGGNSYTVTQGVNTILAKTPSSFGNNVRFVGNVTAACFPGAQTTFTAIPQVSFLPRGTTNPPVGTILLMNNRGSEATITYNITGKTHVCFNLK